MLMCNNLMEKAEIRLVRIDKEVYWLHGLA